MTKVIIIGLDGAPFEIIKEITKNNKNLGFEKFLAGGCSGKLESTIPNFTPSAWTSMYTGKNPGKHGIFSFFKSHQYEKVLVTSKDIKSKPIWSILSTSKKKVGIINVPMFYPPQKVNGFMISGYPAPDSNDFAYPDNMNQLLRRLGYKIYVDEIFFDGNEEKYLKNLYNVTSTHENATTELMKNYEWDFFITTFYYTDQIQHYFWKHLNTDSKYKNEIFKYYIRIDQFIEKIINKLDKDTILLVLSDHGAQKQKKVIYLNKYFQDLGLLETKNSNNPLRKFLIKIGLNEPNLRILGSILRVNKIFSKKKLLSIQRFLPSNSVSIDALDWNQTKIYSLSDNCTVFINLKGRNPKGIVDKEEYYKLREYIIEKLYELKDPENGEKVIEKVYKPEEIYSGEFIGDAPDLIVSTKNSEYTISDYINPCIFSSNEERSWSGTHSRFGIILAYGHGIKKNYEIQNARIYDIAPTILHIFGLPIPDDMDGKVLTEIFDEESEFAKRKPIYADPCYYELKQEKERIKSKIRKLKTHTNVKKNC